MAEGSTAAAPGPRVPPWLLLILIGIPVFFVWLGLGGGAAKLPVEVRSRDIVGTMARTGDWLVPRVGGQPFLSKPPLYHWLGALASQLRGETDWWSVRAPSALAAMVFLGVTVAWGTALGGIALGGAAGLMTGLMAMFVILARRGAPDMVFSAASVAALFFFERIWHGRRRNLFPAFSLAVALAVLAKGPAVLPVVGAPVALFLTLRWGWRRVLRRDVLLWLGAAAAAGASWYVMIFLRMPKVALHWALLEGLQPVAIELVGHTGRHFEGPWYYLYRIWDIALPASVLLPMTAWHVWRTGRWRGRGEWPFVVWSFCLVVLLFSLLPAKQPHYILPLLPLLGLMTGDALLAHLQAPPGTPGDRFLTCSLGVLLVLMVAGVVLGAYYAALFADVWAAAAWAGVLGGAVGLVPTVRWWLMGRNPAACLGAVAVVGCLGLLYFGSFEEWKSLDRQADRAAAADRGAGQGAPPVPAGGSAKP